MSHKTGMLFTTSILFASFAILVLPSASGLISNEVDNSHVTARFSSHLKICGNEICKPGEKTNWQKAVWGHQTVSQGKISHHNEHGEDVMHKLSGSSTHPETMHGTEKPTVSTTPPVIKSTK
jgi:hypothetical protein